jgi:hypothetical protein
VAAARRAAAAARAAAAGAGAEPPRDRRPHGRPRRRRDGAGGAEPRDLAAFCAAEALLAAGRAAISGSLEAWFVDATRTLDPEAPLRRPLSRASAASALGLAAGALLGGIVPGIDLGLPATGDDPLLLYSPAILLGAGLAATYLVGVAVLVRGPGAGAAGGSTERGLAALRAVGVAAAGSVRASLPVRLLLLAGLGLGVALTAVETLWQPRLSELLGGAAGNTTLFGVVEPLHLELLHEEVPSGARATMLSVESLAEQLGGVTSSLTLPRLAAGAGIPAAFWVAAGVMGAVAVVARALPGTR